VKRCQWSAPVGILFQTIKSILFYFPSLVKSENRGSYLSRFLKECVRPYGSEARRNCERTIKNCPVSEHLKHTVSKISCKLNHLQKSGLLASKLLFYPSKLVCLRDAYGKRRILYRARDNFPRLILGYIFDGKTVEIYKNRETYIVVNMKTEKFLTCIGYEHAHYVFEECVRKLEPQGNA